MDAFQLVITSHRYQIEYRLNYRQINGPDNIISNLKNVPGQCTHRSQYVIAANISCYGRWSSLPLYIWSVIFYSQSQSANMHLDTLYIHGIIQYTIQVDNLNVPVDKSKTLLRLICLPRDIFGRLTKVFWPVFLIFHFSSSSEFVSRRMSLYLIYLC